MTFKIFCMISMAASYVISIMAFTYGLNQAKKVHRVNLKDVKNEIPGGFWLRGICSMVYYFGIIDWIFEFGVVPWAYLTFPVAVNYAGILLLALTVLLFWWIHLVLGSNYHGPLKLHDNHQLVTSGPYAFARHPTYVAFPMLHLSYFLITNNFLIIIAGFTMSFFVNQKRIKIEEKLLTERFGEKYLEYKKKVGMYGPRVFRK